MAGKEIEHSIKNQARRILTLPELYPEPPKIADIDELVVAKDKEANNLKSLNEAVKGITQPYFDLMSEASDRAFRMGWSNREFPFLRNWSFRMKKPLSLKVSPFSVASYPESELEFYFHRRRKETYPDKLVFKIKDGPSYNPKEIGTLEIESDGKGINEIIFRWPFGWKSQDSLIGSISRTVMRSSSLPQSEFGDMEGEWERIYPKGCIRISLSPYPNLRLELHKQTLYGEWSHSTSPHLVNNLVFKPEEGQFISTSPEIMFDLWRQHTGDPKRTVSDQEFIDLLDKVVSLIPTEKIES